ncbi:hypothetical protein [Frankia sp. EAN1pec]|uniref:hypothetical protein n=1 Tax=Parafrankia sp. (strain EAN1pec) TaxID=298653 RepID=UPI0002DDEE93
MHRIDVPDGFQETSPDVLDAFARKDPRLAAACEAGRADRAITQVLAGGVDLLERYTHTLDDQSRALLTAAMDIRRLGRSGPLPGRCSSRRRPATSLPASGSPVPTGSPPPSGPRPRNSVGSARSPRSGPRPASASRTGTCYTTTWSNTPTRRAVRIPYPRPSGKHSRRTRLIRTSWRGSRWRRSTEGCTSTRTGLRSRLGTTPMRWGSWLTG